MQSNPQYATDIVKFINIIICYSIEDVSLFEIIGQEVLLANMLLFKNISQKALSASLNKTDKALALKLYKDINAIASKIQIHSPPIIQPVSNIEPPLTKNVDLFSSDLALRELE